ncbi:hypothetical protein SGPA1_40754 [Streptomyces misionensis JCM 4497]
MSSASTGSGRGPAPRRYAAIAADSGPRASGSSGPRTGWVMAPGYPRPGSSVVPSRCPVIAIRLVLGPRVRGDGVARLALAVVLLAVPLGLLRLVQHLAQCRLGPLLALVPTGHDVSLPSVSSDRSRVARNGGLKPGRRRRAPRPGRAGDRAGVPGGPRPFGGCRSRFPGGRGTTPVTPPPEDRGAMSAAPTGSCLFSDAGRPGARPGPAETRPRPRRLHVRVVSGCGALDTPRGFGPGVRETCTPSQ